MLHSPLAIVGADIIRPQNDGMDATSRFRYAKSDAFYGSRTSVKIQINTGTAWVKRHACSRTKYESQINTCTAWMQRHVA